jgi:hypothetical protein
MPVTNLKTALFHFSQTYKKPGVAGVAGVADNDINKLAATPCVSEGVAGVAGTGCSRNTSNQAVEGVAGKVLRIKCFNNNLLQTSAIPATPQHQKNNDAGKFSAVATIATLQDFEKEFDRFRNSWSQGQSKLRKEQACWCAEVFLRDLGQLAVEFGWMPDDIFASIRGARTGLAWWLAADGTDVIRALGPEHAVTEGGSRIYDRVTRCSWIEPQ